MTQTPNDDGRRRWIAMLAKLVHPQDPAFAAKALVDMLPMLRDMPDDAYTLASLDHVALGTRRIPSYAELRAALTEWWSANKPAVAPDVKLIEGRGGVKVMLDDTDESWLRYHQKRVGEITAEPIQRPHIESKLKRLDSLVRNQSPRAWQVISGEAPPRGPLSEEEVQAVSRKLADLKANLQWGGKFAPRGPSGAIADSPPLSQAANTPMSAIELRRLIAAWDSEQRRGNASAALRLEVLRRQLVVREREEAAARNSTAPPPGWDEQLTAMPEQAGV